MHQLLTIRLSLDKSDDASLYVTDAGVKIHIGLVHCAWGSIPEHYKSMQLEEELWGLRAMFERSNAIVINFCND